MSYYATKLAGRRLQRCYDVAPPRVRQYLASEIRHLLGQLRQEDSVLELGCGYGRVALRLAPHVRRVVGIDTAPESLELARLLAGGDPRCDFLERDALDTGLPDDAFDAVVCVQNGIGAFGVVIVCSDGFRAGRATPRGLRALCLAHRLEPEITEVDGSRVFCRIRKPGT